MKASFLRALKSRNTPLMTKMLGLLSFIALCIICLISPIVTLAGNNPNTVVFVKDYGNISQFVVMPNGQLSMKPKMNSILHAINRRFVSSTATNTPDACTTLDALINTDGSPDALNIGALGGSPDALGGSPDALDSSSDGLDNATCLSLLSAANSDSSLDLSGSPDSLDLHSCSDSFNLSGSPDSLNLSGSPDSLDLNSCSDSLDLSGSPDALGTCTNGTSRSKKMSVLGFEMPPGEILAVQSGKDVVVAISLDHNQVLMPNGTTMNLR